MYGYNEHIHTQKRDMEEYGGSPYDGRPRRTQTSTADFKQEYDCVWGEEEDTHDNT